MADLKNYLTNFNKNYINYLRLIVCSRLPICSTPFVAKGTLHIYFVLAHKTNFFLFSKCILLVKDYITVKYGMFEYFFTQYIRYNMFYMQGV